MTKPKAQTRKVWVKHIIEEDSRFHVLYWDNKGTHCTEPRCEINRPAKPKGKK